MKLRRGTLFHKCPELLRPKNDFHLLSDYCSRYCRVKRDLNGEYSLPPSGRVKEYNIEGNTIPKSSALGGGEL